MAMAPTLSSSNSLLLTSTTTSHQSRVNHRSRRLSLQAQAKRSPFQLQLGKEEKGTKDQEQPPSSGFFRFDIGKVADLKSLVRDSSSGLSFGSPKRKDPGTVFVAGAAGQVGVRISQTLLREGFSIRAGVPDLGAAQELARLAASYKLISNEESRRLNAVESTFDDPKSIAKAIGNAAKVVVTIGPSENGPAAEVSTADALQVIKAAQLAGVGHVAIIYDGNTSGASTYNVLDGFTSFFNNLFSQSQPLTVPELLQEVIETDLSYTFIKTSLTDDFSPESGYNVIVSAEGSIAGSTDYKVAKSRIASLVADVLSNTTVAQNKVVEVFTDPSAPFKRVDELFNAIPEDKRRGAYAEAKAEEEARIAVRKAREAAEAATKLEAEVQKLSEREANKAVQEEMGTDAAGSSILSKAKEFGSGLSWDKLSSQITNAVQTQNPLPKLEANEAREETDAATASILSKAKEFGSGLSWDKLSSQITNAVQTQNPLPKVQVATIRGQARARSLPSQKAITDTRKGRKPLQPKVKGAEEKKEVRSVLGGLFKQETIYVDED